MKINRLGLLAYLLKTARNNTTRTRVVSQWKRDPGPINDSLMLLTDLGLLSETCNSPVSFVATQKGLQFLGDYRRLREQLQLEKEAPEKHKIR